MNIFIPSGLLFLSTTRYTTSTPCQCHPSSRRCHESTKVRTKAVPLAMTMPMPVQAFGDFLGDTDEEGLCDSVPVPVHAQGGSDGTRGAHYNSYYASVTRNDNARRPLPDSTRGGVHTKRTFAREPAGWHCYAAALNRLRLGLGAAVYHRDANVLFACEQQ